MTALEAKAWADGRFGHGAVSLVWRNGRMIHRVGFIDEFGMAEFPGEGAGWDEAVRRIEGAAGEVEEIRQRGQG